MAGGEHEEGEGGVGGVEPVGAAHEMKEQFRAISAGDLTHDEAALRLDRWCARAQRAPGSRRKAARTMRQRRDLILNAVEARWRRPVHRPSPRCATRCGTAGRSRSCPIRVASQANRSSKSRVRPAPDRANGTASTTTPWSGQARRRTDARSSTRQQPRSRCRQGAGRARVS
jgi:Transposase